jgi:hypothetical protein
MSCSTVNIESHSKKECNLVRCNVELSVEDDIKGEKDREAEIEKGKEEGRKKSSRPFV